jgi:hypothetical protein
MKKVNYLWEQLDETTSRLKVIGGWMIVYGSNKMLTSIFAPDQNHEWYPVRPTTPAAEVKQEIPALLKEVRKQSNV